MPKAPKVLKVKDIVENEKFKDIHPNLPQMPSLLLIIGSVRSGKSNLIVNLFLNPEFYAGKFDIVKIISTTLNTDTKGKILKEHFDCMDHYEDGVIDGIKKEQSKFPKEERPTFALVLDDVLTKDFSKSNAVSFFSTRFRHYIDMYVIATQSFRAVSGMIRNNAQDVIICRQQNQKEKDKIAEEFSDMVGGSDVFMELYDEIHSKPYQFMYLKLSTNPAEVYRNFEEKLYPK
tara:strand:- start:4855 stop:5550 length:696 start_codon:yes stop_codon:yes gene_type:complete